MKKLLMVMIVSTALLGSACQGDRTLVSKIDSDETKSAPVLTPEQLGEIGAEIKKNPDDAKTILESKGLDEASFEKAVRNVTEDPEASKKYADAFKKNA